MLIGRNDISNNVITLGTCFRVLILFHTEKISRNFFGTKVHIGWHLVSSIDGWLSPNPTTVQYDELLSAYKLTAVDWTVGSILLNTQQSD